MYITVIVYKRKTTTAAPLIRFRPWRYINLFTYLLTITVHKHNITAAK